MGSHFFEKEPLFQWTNPHALLWVIGVTKPGGDPTLWTIEAIGFTITDLPG